LQRRAWSGKDAEVSASPSASRRFALLWAAQFFALGAMMPFLPAILAEGGLAAAEVGAVMAAGSLVRLLAAPMGGMLADQAADTRHVTALGFGLAAGLWALLAVQVTHSVLAAPVVPLSDALALGAVRAGRFDYARVRAVGSVAFIAGAVAAGQAAEFSGPRAAAWLLTAGLALAALAALGLPAVPPRPRELKQSLWAPLREPAFRRILPVAALIQGSHAVYYGFSTLHWQAAGLGSGFVGVLWGLGVLAEVVLFVYGRPLADRLGLCGLALLAALAGILRWGVSAETVHPFALLAVQLLHGATFGAMHLAAMRALLGLAPGLAGRAQALLASAVSASTGGLIWLSGPLYAAAGGGAFWAMAALCALAAPLAWRLR
jgi:PPP family 3-phenylpropionic acid transporter